MATHTFEIFYDDLRKPAQDAYCDFWGFESDDEVQHLCPIAEIVREDDDDFDDDNDEYSFEEDDEGCRECMVPAKDASAALETNPKYFFYNPKQVTFLCPIITDFGYEYHSGIAFNDYIIDGYDGEVYYLSNLVSTFPNLSFHSIVKVLDWEHLPIGF